MSLKGSYVIIIVMAVSLFFGIDYVFGQIQDSIVVTTDKASYSEGEIIIITGEVRDLYGIPVSIIVTSPSENTVAMMQVDVGADKKFSTKMAAGGALMKLEGTYTIKVTYGNESRTAETSFEFGGVMEEHMEEETMMEETMEEEFMMEESVPPPYPQPTYDTTPPKILKPTDITVNAKNQNGAVVTFDVLTIDDTDEIVNTICTPASNSFFTIGETRIICNARDSSGNRAVPISFNITVNAAGSVIPEWVKNVAIFWCDNKIDDTSFIEGIQYLIENDIITVSITTSGFGIIQEIPQWVKNNACWWSKDLISDKEFTSGIEFLVNLGIIRV